eukprot:scaffold36680_cov51-Cyclotella_meneghiniana.AAC.2
MHYTAPAKLLGWLAFSSALEAHPTLEDLEIPYKNYAPDLRANDTDGLNLIIRGVTSNSRLKRVHVTCHPIRDFNTRREDDALTVLLLSALEINTSLKVVRFYTTEFDDGSLFGDTKINYEPFCNLLGNMPSIDDTYNSNHSLQYLCFESQYDAEEDEERDVEVPMKLYFLLNLNKDCSKRNVAIKKIIRFHTLKDVKFDYSTVSNAISSVGNVDSKEGLSGMYEILRKMPDLYY